MFSGLHCDRSLHCRAPDMGILFHTGDVNAPWCACVEHGERFSWSSRRLEHRPGKTSHFGLKATCNTANVLLESFKYEI